MQPLSEFKQSEIKVVFTDIDDTLTKNGLLQASAYESIWNLCRAGLKVVPVTGRPAGWCELIARQWPVTGVIGENGGLYFYYHQKKMHRCYSVDEASRVENNKKLDQIRREVLQQVPGSAVASDQFCRQMDLAIDFCEDVKPLDQEDVQKIVDIFAAHGAQAKISSIHVNGWFGDYDKLSMCKRFSKEVLDLDLDKEENKAVFVGDSPNDEPMWSFFTNGFAVANVHEFLSILNFLPAFVSQHSHGAGFSEIAQRILEVNFDKNL